VSQTLAQGDAYSYLRILIPYMKDADLIQVNRRNSELDTEKEEEIHIAARKMITA
jgi:hypothetical protein